MLRRDTIIIGGGATNRGVETSVREAFNMDIATIVVRECCWGGDAAAHAYSLDKAMKMYARIREPRSGRGDVARLITARPAPALPIRNLGKVSRSAADGRAFSPGDADMTNWTETYRGTVPPWQCDVTEHFTVGYYFDRLEEAEANLADALGIGDLSRRGDLIAPARCPFRARTARRRRLSCRERAAQSAIDRVAASGHRFVDSANGEVVTWFDETLGPGGRAADAAAARGDRGAAGDVERSGGRSAGRNRSRPPVSSRPRAGG